MSLYQGRRFLPQRFRLVLLSGVPGRDNPSVYPIGGGNAEGLMAKLDAARDRVAQVTGRTPKVTLCYEAGYDGFWLARFLEQRGIECLVMEPASLQVNRKARRVKTDRIDVEKLLHALIAWCRGERHVCSMVLYQGALIMTHRDGFPRFSARSAWRGAAGHREPWAPSQSHGPSESLGKPPFRSRRRTAGGRNGAGVGKP